MLVNLTVIRSLQGCLISQDRQQKLAHKQLLHSHSARTKRFPCTFLHF